MDLAGPSIRTEEVITPEDGHKVQAGYWILITFDQPRPRPDFVFQASCGVPEALRGAPVGATASIRDGRIVGQIVERRTRRLGPRGDTRRPQGAVPATPPRHQLPRHGARDLALDRSRSDGSRFRRRSCRRRQLLVCPAARGHGPAPGGAPAPSSRPARHADRGQDRDAAGRFHLPDSLVKSRRGPGSLSA